MADEAGTRNPQQAGGFSLIVSRAVVDGADVTLDGFG